MGSVTFRNAPGAVGEEDARVPLILVVDPSDDHLALMRLLLADEGYRVRTARTIAEAGEQIVAERPALVIAELRLGAVTSLTLPALLAEPDGGAAVPLLICTADLRLAERLVPGLRSHLGGVIFKPFDIEDLLRQVAGCLAPRDRPTAER